MSEGIKWRLVPAEADDAMIETAEDAMEMMRANGKRIYAAEVYDIILDAAPNKEVDLEQLVQDINSLVNWHYGYMSDQAYDALDRHRKAVGYLDPTTRRVDTALLQRLNDFINGNKTVDH